ncbi:MAG: CHAT domain-containing protein, partial [Jaaginema sp. PMC 1080.18]|nr:CHAT domain-containing protein [Jaaginema sp. PMC 1080.18]MEC4868474.1 CHAT domain-containing protein [Jaaginema sp. PMC 1078.18]
VYTREAFPEQWAGTQNNLANAYSDRIRGNRAENLENAIRLYQEALTIRTRQAFPQNHTQTLHNLGFAYQDLSRHHSNNPEQKQIALTNAYNSFAQALDTVEYLRGEIISGDETKRKLNEEWNQLYRGIVEVSLELGNPNSALEYIDRSKARNLVEEIAIRETHPNGIPPEIPQQLQHLRNAIAQENQRLSQDKNPDYSHIDQLRQAYQALAPYHPLQLQQMQALLDEETAILEWYILGDTFLTFTLTAQSLRFWQSSPEDRDNLGDWVIDYLNDYRTNKTQWRNSLTQRLATLADILHLNDRINDLFHHFPHCKRLILIPHRFLHLFPLHALPVTRTDPNSKEDQTTQSLQDWFSNGVNYAPNCQLLRQAQNRHRPHFDRLFAIQNPTQDLAFTDIEVEALQPYFNPHHILKHAEAQKAALNLDNAHCAHFSCHGYFNFNNPLLSALILANSELSPPPPQDNPNRYLPQANGKYLDLGQCLTLTDILQLNLRECRLVTLSACETGQVQLDSTDEYISLASGFILAGASAVVSSLWAVNDLSTALLMIRFYQNLKNGETVPLALQHAQTWLREATKADLTTWASSCLRPAVQFALRSYLRNAEEVPFQSPYYWAAFYAVGG